MAELSDRIENVLNEARMLLLGGQVLLGFSYQICFAPRFEGLQTSARLAQVAGLGILTAGMGWLIWPVAFHQIAERGAETEPFHNFTTRILDWALLPLAAALGLSFYPVSAGLRLPHPAWIGSAATMVALLLWYGVSLGRRGSRRLHLSSPQRLEGQPRQRRLTESELSDRIKKLLIECRMALPGAQAFLGFQFAIVFSAGFDRLPRSSQIIHFGSLVATTTSIVLLIAPAAYHRLAEGGRNSEHFLRVANRLLLLALVFLAPGMTGDLLVVMRKVTGNLVFSSWIALGAFFAFYGLWFGLSTKWRTRS